ncbi:MAG: selenide, water dikinase SelD [Candidatus Eremiobacteraeota bacterium]|nr:selenide, water dikinase SelD [Candidatus Eremiobacteraeota bacterium]
MAQVLRRLPPSEDANILVGLATRDDAGVYKVRNDLALVQTVDFFTPIVDDPFDFGRIAAANALSDVYAMGATPLTALNICAFPVEDLDISILIRILEGGAAVAKQAGVALLGGHTIKDAEPKYGMAITGTVDPRKIVTNAGARPGDFLILTKPLGTGILTTALKRERIEAAALQPALEAMLTLNDVASRAMVETGVHAATDVTGYGLLGHAAEMMEASQVALEFASAEIPLFDGVLELIDEGIVPGGSRDNATAHAAFTEYAEAVTPAMRAVLSDAQTSGGLLIALDPAKAETLKAKIGPAARVVGRVRGGTGITVLA